MNQEFSGHTSSNPLKYVKETENRKVRHGHRNRILMQLEEIYANAFHDGVYPSALKAVELNIRMLKLMESESGIIGLSDLNAASVGNLLKDMDEQRGEMSAEDYSQFAKKSGLSPASDTERKSAHKYDDYHEEPPENPFTQLRQPVQQIFSRPSTSPILRKPRPTEYRVADFGNHKIPPIPEENFDEFDTEANELQKISAEIEKIQVKAPLTPPIPPISPKSSKNTLKKSPLPSLSGLDKTTLQKIYLSRLKSWGTEDDFSSSDMDEEYTNTENPRPTFQAGQQLKNKPG